MQVGAVLSRCERWSALLFALRWFERFARIAARGLVLGLIAAASARALGWSLAWLGPSLGAWCALSGVLASRGRAALAIPPWQLPAYVDRASGARGALMLRHASITAARGAPRLPDPGHAEVPDAAAQVRLRAPWPRQTLLGALFFAGAYALCLCLPLPAAGPAARAKAAPLAIQRASQIVQQLRPRDAQTQAFKAAAQDTLRALAAQEHGLSRADFDTLARIEAHGRSLLARPGAQAQDARDALAATDALLAAYAAHGGAAREAEALRAGLESMRDALEQAGVDGAALAAMAAAAKRAAAAGQEGAKGKPKPGSDGPSQAFDPKSVQALREQLGALQKLSASAGSSGQGETSRDGPGVTPLQFEHHTREPSGTQYDSNTFSTRKAGETVLLSSGSSKHAEPPPRAEPHGVSAQQFSAGSDTEYWHEHRSPQLRGVLERYFQGAAPK